MYTEPIDETADSDCRLSRRHDKPVRETDPAVEGRRQADDAGQPVEGAGRAVKSRREHRILLRPAKDHGRENLIEGEITEGQSVVVIEDLISTGKSSLKAVQALREVGCKVKGMISIFTYGFHQAENNFEKEQCPIISLCDYSILLEQAVESNYIKAKDLEVLNKWKEEPESWSGVIQ